MMLHTLVMNILKVFLCVNLIQFPMSFAQESATNHSEHLLYNLLLDYNLYVRPMQHLNTTINITTRFVPISIKQYNEMEGTLSFIAILGLEWTDMRMVWDPNMYGGVNYINVGYDKVWVPDLYCINSATSFMPVGTEKERIGFYHNGLAVYTPGALFTVLCQGNIEKYPFDSQTCHMSLNAWNYRKGEVSLVPALDVINLKALENNNMWTVVNSFAGHILNPDSVQLDFFMEIKRKSKFVTVNVVIPLAFLSCLNNLVFLLVPESGERISLCITVLLSISVYLTILNHTLPQNSEPVPLISYKIIADLAVSYLIMLMVVINLRFYNKSVKERVPHCVKVIYKFMTCKCKKAKDIMPTYVHDSVTVSTDCVDNLEVSENLTDKTQIQAPSRNDTTDDNITWREISAFVDFVCLILFNIVTFCSFYVFLRMTFF